jgi:hypothetical protein
MGEKRWGFAEQLGIEFQPRKIRNFYEICGGTLHIL